MESIHEKTFDIEHIAEISLSFQPKVKPSLRPVLTSGLEVVQLLSQLWNKDHIELCEEFKVILLNRRNAVLGVINLSKGGITGTVLDPRLVLAAALKCGAVSIILAHNHPSGSVKPSESDINLTQKVKHAASYFDIRVADHIIITSEGYLSFTEEGLM